MTKTHPSEKEGAFWPNAVEAHSNVYQVHLSSRLIRSTYRKRLSGPSIIGQARSQGGFGGCGRTPLFLGPKKKSRWCPRLAAACSGCDRTCMHRRIYVGLRIHGPEPNLESVAVYDQRQTIGIPSNVYSAFNFSFHNFV